MCIRYLVTAVIAFSLPGSVLPAQTVPRPLTSALDLAEVSGVVVSTGGVRQHTVLCLCTDTSGKQVWRGYAGEDGVFRVKLPPGSYRIWALGAKVRAVDLTVPDGADTVAAKVIGRSHNYVKLRFVTPQGKPVAGVRVGLGRTNSNGTAVLTAHDAPINDMFFEPGLGYGRLKIDTDEELFRPEPIRVIFHTGRPVVGRAVSESTGRPLGGLLAFPVRQEESGDEWADWNSYLGMDPYADYAITSRAIGISRDGDGAFAVGPLPPGDYTLLFGFSAFLEFRDMAKVPIHVVEGEPLKPLNVRIRLKEPMYALRARLLTRKHKPVACKEIVVAVTTAIDSSASLNHAYIWEPVTRRVKTDKEGRFTLYPFYAGEFYFKISEGGGTAGNAVTFPKKGMSVDFVIGDLVRGAVFIERNR